MEIEERMQLLGQIHAMHEVVAFSLAATLKLYGLKPEEAYDRVLSVSAVVEQGLLEADDGSALLSAFADGAAQALERIAKSTRTYSEQI